MTELAALVKHSMVGQDVMFDIIFNSPVISFKSLYGGSMMGSSVNLLISCLRYVLDNLLCEHLVRILIMRSVGVLRDSFMMTGIFHCMLQSLISALFNLMCHNLFWLKCASPICKQESKWEVILCILAEGLFNAALAETHWQ